MMSLKPVSLAFAAATLITIAGVPPAGAQQYGGPPPQYGAPAPPQYGAPPPPQYGAPAEPQYGAAAEPQNAGPTQLVTNGPQANVETQSPNWSAQQNVVQSERYDRLLETNTGFRDARIQKECGPITDPQLHQNCISSFAQMEPSTAASAPPRHRRS
jgi:hypothetical protein